MILLTERDTARPLSIAPEHIVEIVRYRLTSGIDDGSILYLVDGRSRFAVESAETVRGYVNTALGVSDVPPSPPVE